MVRALDSDERNFPLPATNSPVCGVQYEFPLFSAHPTWLGKFCIHESGKLVSLKRQSLWIGVTMINTRFEKAILPNADGLCTHSRRVHLTNASLVNRSLNLN